MKKEKNDWHRRKMKNSGKILTVFILASLLFIGNLNLQAQRKMEHLTRGLVAVKADDGIFLSWRIFATDSSDISFNIYRNGEMVNNEPISGKSNLTDPLGKLNDCYYLESIMNGVKTKYSSPVIPWENEYLSIPIQTPPNYTPNDASVADLDGDGNLEIIVKMEGSTRDNSQDGRTDPVQLHAYQLDGSLMWSIDLGINIRGGAHYTQFMVYDLDGDGKAEIACKTAPGTKDGTGAFLSLGPAASDDDSKNYVNSGGWILDGPEYLTVFNGLTGAEMATVAYVPVRGNVNAWGDDYGNRVDRFLAAVAYLDGEKPSLVMCRGYYTRTVLVAWDWREGELTQRWKFDTDDDFSSYRGQGYHSLSVADVDEDGKDEIVYGSACIDDDGTGLWNSRLGHGDALHVSDIDPSIPGQEVWGIHEYAQVHGSALLKAATGEVIWGTEPADVGRGVTADLTADFPGMESWGGTNQLRSAKNELAGSWPSSSNFLIWWDGDLLRELLNGTSVHKYVNGSDDIMLMNAANCDKNNGSKSTPALSGDILGDWREEVMFRTIDGSELRLYTTTIPSDHGLFTLLQDAQYRMALTWQNVGYNQPPHPSFFLGAGMEAPARPNIEIVKAESTPSISFIKPIKDYEHPLGKDFQVALKIKGIADTSSIIICQDNNNIDTILQPPYFISIPSLTTGNYKISAKTKDINGSWVYSDSINITVDEGYPFIDIISPSNNQLLWAGEDVLISADAYDYDGIVDSVEFYLNDTLISTQTSSPYEFTVENPAPNIYEMHGIVYDDKKHATSSDTIAFLIGNSSRIYQENQDGFCGFTVGSGTIDSNHPGYTGDGFLNTANAVGSAVTWGLVFSEPGVYLASWRYASGSQRDGELIVDDVSAIPVAFPSSGDWTIWDSTSVSFKIENKGYHELILRSTQNEGLGNVDYLKIITTNALLSPEPGDCSVDDEVKNGYPYVKITTPDNEQLFSTEDSITITFETLDYDGEIDSIEFYLNDVLINTILDGANALKIANPGKGIHAFKGTAFDDSGNSKTSETANINVGFGTFNIQEEEGGFCGLTSLESTIANSNTGFTGNGYIDSEDAIKEGIYWAVDFPEAGKYNLNWRFAQTIANSATLIVNDRSAATINFEPTADLNTWGETSYYLEVTETGNTRLLLISDKSNGLPNIDYLKVTSLTSENAATVGDCSSIVNVGDIAFEANTISIYPSPVKDVLNISINNQHTIQKVAIFSIDGTQLLSEQYNNAQIAVNVSDLKNGIYIVKLETLNDVYIKKFVVKNN